MPELWLKYGSTEVVLDIKAENLLDYVTWAVEHAGEEQIAASLASIRIPGGSAAQIAVLDSSRMLAKLCSTLVESLGKRAIPIGGIHVPAGMLSAYRSIFQEKGMQQTVVLGRIPNDMERFATRETIFLSQTSFDSLFGYAGTPTHLLRYFGRVGSTGGGDGDNGDGKKDQMLDAYRARSGDLPTPGSSGRALQIAHRFAEGFDSATSIEAIPGSRGVADIVVDRPVRAHQAAIAKLESLATAEVEKSKAAIISPGGDRPSTLSGALNSLWNCVGAAREEGGSSIALLAECRDGLGSAALERLIEGKLRFKDTYNPPEYVEGLEDLLYLGEAGKKYELMLITALPDYYAKKVLGFKTFRQIRDALQHMLNIHGPRQKVLVVSDGSRVMLKPKK